MPNRSLLPQWQPIALHGACAGLLVCLAAASAVAETSAQRAYTTSYADPAGPASRGSWLRPTRRRTQTLPDRRREAPGSGLHDVVRSPCRTGVATLLAPAYTLAAKLPAEKPARKRVPKRAEPIRRVLFGSCAKQDRPLPIFQTIVRQRPDLFLFLGDNIYGDTDDMKVLRAKYARLGADAGFRRLLAACPVLATWDDHDYGVNDGGADYRQRDASQRAFVDFWRDPADSPRRRRPGVYEARVFGPPGKRLQVVMLDTRYFRSPLKKGTRRVGGSYVPDADRRKTMLGAKQWKWLERQLRAPADVRILVSSIQAVAEDAGQETWSNLPHQRQRLFDLIAQSGAEGVVLVSGDRHWAELSVATERTPYPLYDLTSSSFNQIHGRGTPTRNRFRALPKTYHRENFGAILIDWDAVDPIITLEIRDLEGRTVFRKRVPRSTLRKRS